MSRTPQNAFIESELGILYKVRDLTSCLKSACEEFNSAEKDLEEAKQTLKRRNERVDELAVRIRNYEERLHELREQLRRALEPPSLISLPISNGECLMPDTEEIACRQQ